MINFFISTTLVLSFFLFENQTATAQQPVPPDVLDVDVQNNTGNYFSSATEDDKAFIDGVRTYMDENNIRGFRRWRIERRLRQPAFVRTLQQELKAEIYWSNPHTYADGSPVQIDWSAIDWEKVFDLIMQLIQLFFVVQTFDAGVTA